MLMFFFYVKKKKKALRKQESKNLKQYWVVLNLCVTAGKKKKQHDNSVCKASDEGVCYNKEVGLETSWGPFRLDCSKILWTWGEIWELRLGCLKFCMCLLFVCLLFHCSMLPHHKLVSLCSEACLPVDCELQSKKQTVLLPFCPPLFTYYFLIVIFRAVV